MTKYDSVDNFIKESGQETEVYLRMQLNNANGVGEKTVEVTTSLPQ